MSLTTCSILLSRALLALSKSICASSKKNTNLGLSISPTSGSVSYISESIHSKSVEYIVGLSINFWQSSNWIYPLPDASVPIQSIMSMAGSPKNISPPSLSRAISALIIVVIEDLAILP